MKVIHYVEFLLPGVLLAETSIRVVPRRDPLAIQVPPAAYAFRFYDVIERTATREDGKKLTDREQVRWSGMFFPGGKAYTLPELKRQFPKETILISNVKCNQWKGAIKTRCGNWQPWESTDQII